MPRFQTKPVEVDVVQLRCAYRFDKASGRAGDWLVTYDDGTQAVIRAGAFASDFEPVHGNGTAARVAPTPKTSAPKASAKSAKHGRAQISLETWAVARKEYERGVAPKLIAARLGCVESAIYWRAKHHGWAKPTAKPAAAAKPQGEELRGRVRCQSCQQLTGYDPCEHCGAQVAFKA